MTSQEDIGLTVIVEVSDDRLARMDACLRGREQRSVLNEASIRLLAPECNGRRRRGFQRGRRPVGRCRRKQIKPTGPTEIPVGADSPNPLHTTWQCLRGQTNLFEVAV